MLPLHGIGRNGAGLSEPLTFATRSRYLDMCPMCLNIPDYYRPRHDFSVICHHQMWFDLFERGGGSSSFFFSFLSFPSLLFSPPFFYPSRFVLFCLGWFVVSSIYLASLWVL